jgi:hypothetical protein
MHDLGAPHLNIGRKEKWVISNGNGKRLLQIAICASASSHTYDLDYNGSQGERKCFICCDMVTIVLHANKR